MKERCYLSTHKAFKSYGGSGIFVCDEWRYSFDNFVSDMGKRPKGKTLDRIDNTKGYFKENCRWASKLQQQNNLKSNIKVSIAGVEKGLSEWSKIYRINKQTVSERIKRGWDPIKAITTKTGVITRWSK